LWNEVIVYVDSGIAKEDEHIVGRNEVIWQWLVGEQRRTSEWAMYVQNSIPSSYLDQPVIGDPVEDYMRERLFLSLRRRLFCEVPVDTVWYRAKIALHPSWAQRFEVLWTDRNHASMPGRGVSLDHIVLWEHNLTPGRYFVLEGNHRVSQWLLNNQSTTIMPMRKYATVLLGRSRSLCSWVHRQCPVLFEWNDRVYSELIHPVSGIAIDRAQISTDEPRSIVLPYLIVILILFVLVSTLLHILHPHWVHPIR
jgi:hypothetical protein